MSRFARPVELLPQVGALRQPESNVIGIDDADLVRRAQTGDRRAEDYLFRRHSPAVSRVVVRLLGSRQDAEDVVHDAFVIAFTKLATLREPSAFRGWLMRIAVVRVRRVIRRRRLKRALGLLPSAADDGLERLAGKSVSPEVRAELAVIDRLLSRMPANDRVAWVLRMVEGHQLAEVAEICGCSLATAKRRIAAAQRAIEAVVDVRPPEEST